MLCYQYLVNKSSLLIYTQIFAYYNNKNINGPKSRTPYPIFYFIAICLYSGVQVSYLSIEVTNISETK